MRNNLRPKAESGDVAELNHTDDLRRASMAQLRADEALMERILDAVVGDEPEPIEADA